MQASAEQQFKGARPAEETVARAYKFADLSSYPPKKRFLIRAADLAFFFLIKVIGRTIRWQVEGWENWEAADARRPGADLYLLAQPRIPCDLLLAKAPHRRDDFAEFRRRIHREVHSKIWLRRGARLEHARRRRRDHRNDEADARRLPDGVYDRWSKRSALRREDGRGAAGEKDRTTDPAVHDHRATLGSERSWDGFQVPLPFARARVDIAPPIYVSADTDDEALEAKRDELQAALDEHRTAV